MVNKKRTVSLGFLLVMACQAILSQNTRIAEDIGVVRSEDSVQIRMTISLIDRQMGNNEKLLITPRLVNSEDSVQLPSLDLYGKNPYYYYIRSGNDKDNPNSAYWHADENNTYRLRGKDCPDAIRYVATVPHKPWMDHASLKLCIRHTGLCDGVMAETVSTVYSAQPTFVDNRPRQECEKGIAHIDFIVNSTELREDYHNNAGELDRINQTIEDIINDPSARILDISLKGYSSPEGPYDNNARLARGRTESLRRYMTGQLRLPDYIIQTGYEPEDWEGLRRYVDGSTLPHRQEILAIIASKEDPDVKLAHIREWFPDEYKEIAENALPYLRHTDYEITYEHTRQHAGEKNAIWALPPATLQPQSPQGGLSPFSPIAAVKTNLLFDLALCFNAEIEVPFGKNRRWSAMLESWFPWYVWHHNSRAYELWTGGIELRRWFSKCPEWRPLLTGNFAAVYAAGGKYDFEWKSVGDQGEFLSFGGTFGHSWVLSRHWNLEASASAGVVFGPRRHYHGEFNDTHLIWKRNANIFYFGPTKLKLSLVYLVDDFINKKKGGRR